MVFITFVINIKLVLQKFTGLFTSQIHVRNVTGFNTKSWTDLEPLMLSDYGMVCMQLSKGFFSMLTV